MNKKRKLCMLWLHEWQLEEYETWFADMARQGWKLERLKLWVAVFVESEPTEVRYRIEIADKNKEIESDRIHLYDDAGWEYVDSRRYMYVFREKQANKGIEIHSDPVHQAETIEVLKKSVRRTGIILGLMTLLMITLVISQLNEMASYYLLGNNILYNLMIIFLYVPLSVNWLLGLKHVYSLIKKLKQGDGLNRNKYYKGKWNRNRITTFIVGGIYISLFIYLIVSDGTFNKETSYPPIPETDLPVVSLTNVENLDLKQVTYDENGIARDMQNYFRERSSIFFPNQYILRQQFTIPKETHSYEPSITSRKYSGITVGVAEKLVAVLKEEEHPPEPFTAVSLNRFDEVWIDENLSNDIQVIAREGKNVYHIYYHGKRPVEVITENLEELINREE